MKKGCMSFVDGVAYNFCGIELKTSSRTHFSVHMCKCN